MRYKGWETEGKSVVTPRFVKKITRAEPMAKPPPSAGALLISVDYFLEISIIYVDMYSITSYF